MKLNCFFRDINHGGNMPQDTGKGEWRQGLVLPSSIGLGFDALRNPRGNPHQTFYTNFGHGVPAGSLAAGADPYFLVSGVNEGTPTLGSSQIGGVRLVSASNPADNDTAKIAASTATGMGTAAIVAASGVRFETMIEAPAIENRMIVAGLNETPTADQVDPGISANDGVGFLFCEYDQIANLTVDPTGASDGALAEADFANWILTEKVDGDDFYYATTIPVVAAVPYVLTIEIGVDLKARYYINGVLAGTSNALSSAAVLVPEIGVSQEEDLGAAEVALLDIAYALLQRFTL